MNDLPEIKDINSVMLTEPVRQALGSASAEVRQWEHQAISYINTEESNLGLHRFSGTALDQGEDRPWSIVLKAVHAPINETDPTHWNYHRREILAYEEGLLNELLGGISAPRCLGVNKYPDGVCWLWLEDVQSPTSSLWSLTKYEMAARHLGQFNGAYLTGHALPKQSWLSQNWMRGWLSYYDAEDREILEILKGERFWEQPLLSSAFPRRITDELSRLRANYDTLLDTLDQLPRTFCHLDAYRPNLFIHTDAQGSSQTVAIDWVFTGIASVGEEIANLLTASLIWFEYDASEAKNLDEAIFSGYLNGLRDSGWQGDARLARL
ncbi:MAG: aminoglycoside phosphotransferase family protein, partial [Anaerolineae bacterium]|nr:aminoglycoside phosphotransferase family protein [Anaerolineae bacterium]